LIYNASGDISGVTNPLNHTTSFTYDLAGRVQSVILPDLRTFNYSYDPNGNITSITPAGTNAHTFTFNPFDLPEYYTVPTVPTSTPATHYTYDNARRITQITKPDSSTVTFNYHPTTQLLTSIVSSGDTTSMTIEPYSGQPQSMTSQDGIATTQTFASRLFVSSATTNASSVNIGAVAYTYNNDFLPTNLTITSASGSSSVNYTYDNDNIMKTAGSLVISLDGTTGIPTKTTLNKIQEVSSYDSSYGEPLSMLAKYVNGSAVTNLFSQSYTRDALGRISIKTETIGTTTNQFAYTYDSAGRLTNVTKNSAAYSNYTLSDNNNATSGNVAGTAFSATYDAQDRILTYNSNTYTHTLNGEMKSKTVSGVTTNFTYDGFGMLKTAKVGTGPVLTYLYDGLNRRIGKKSGSTVQKYWVYQDQLRIGAELNSAGTITKKFIYGTKRNVPDYMIIGSTTYKIVSDHLGSVRLVVNAATGAISQAIEYNERGEVLSDTSPGFQPFGFAGGLYDTDLKLIHFGARDYDPSVGRWLSKDPAGFFASTTNLYEYSKSDPVNYIDRNGRFPGALVLAIPPIIDILLVSMAAIDVALITNEIINWFQNKSKMPTTGVPGSTDTITTPNGDKLKERKYDETGKAKTDIDWDHDHGQGSPHVHDWNWPIPGGDPVRGPGRPPKPGECN
jgi:RHS repeat-associated protein